MEFNTALLRVSSVLLLPPHVRLFLFFCFPLEFKLLLQRLLLLPSGLRFFCQPGLFFLPHDPPEATTCMVLGSCLPPLELPEGGSLSHDPQSLASSAAIFGLECLHNTSNALGVTHQQLCGRRRLLQRHGLSGSGGSELRLLLCYLLRHGIHIGNSSSSGELGNSNGRHCRRFVILLLPFGELLELCLHVPCLLRPGLHHCDGVPASRHGARSNHTFLI
mmetsp:Transcript_31780/g.74220  ORF Transcript_31780/g.74220 Transcript_31780/m.74220 type:complete len:219 (+) Transcript_31780:641-1297(+)